MRPLINCIILVTFFGPSSAIAWQNNHSLFADPLQVGSYIVNPEPYVIAGVKRYGWVIDNQGADFVAIRLEQGGTLIEAVIKYDNQQISIESEGPTANPRCTKSCGIPDKADFWLGNVRRAIALELHAVAINQAGGNVTDRYSTPDFEVFRSQIQSADSRQINLAVREIVNGYVYEDPYLDLAAVRLWELSNTEDRYLASSAARIAKALAKSNGTRYQKLIETIAAQTINDDVRRHTEAALETIIPANKQVESFTL